MLILKTIRTDSGVHALNACATVDLLRNEEALNFNQETLHNLPPSAKVKLFYDPKVITVTLNRTLEKANLDIR